MKGKITGTVPGQIIQLYVTNNIADIFDGTTTGARGRSNATLHTRAGYTYEVDLSDFVLIYNTSAVFASASTSHVNNTTGGSDTMTGVPAHTHTFKDYYGMPNSNNNENKFTSIYLYPGTTATGSLTRYPAGYQRINVSETSKTGSMKRNQTAEHDVGYVNYITHETETTSNSSANSDNRQYTEYVITMSYEPQSWTVGE